MRTQTRTVAVPKFRKLNPTLITHCNSFLHWGPMHARPVGLRRAGLRRRPAQMNGPPVRPSVLMEACVQADCPCLLADEVPLPLPGPTGGTPSTSPSGCGGACCRGGAALRRAMLPTTAATTPGSSCHRRCRRRHPGCSEPRARRCERRAAPGTAPSRNTMSRRSGRSKAVSRPLT